jgi:hypothetical protein
MADLLKIQMPYRKIDIPDFKKLIDVSKESDVIGICDVFPYGILSGKFEDIKSSLTYIKN